MMITPKGTEISRWLSLVPGSAISGLYRRLHWDDRNRPNITPIHESLKEFSWTPHTFTVFPRRGWRTKLPEASPRSNRWPWQPWQAGARTSLKSISGTVVPWHSGECMILKHEMGTWWDPHSDEIPRILSVLGSEVHHRCFRCLLVQVCLKDWWPHNFPKWSVFRKQIEFWGTSPYPKWYIHTF